MLVVIVSVLGLIGPSVTQPLIHNLSSVAPGPARPILASGVTNVQSHRGTAAVAFVVGLVAALWSASGSVAAFMRASNVVWDVEEGRPMWKTYPLRLVVTVVTVILLTVSAVAVVFTGSLAGELGRLVGVGGTAVQIWDVVKWPVMALVVMVILVWLWLTNLVILLGAEFNAELERGRQIQGGHPSDAEPYLPLRDQPKS